MITHAIPTLTVNGEDQHAGLDEFTVSADLDAGQQRLYVHVHDTIDVRII